MYRHIPQKSIELFIKGVIDKKCKDYYLKIGGKKEMIYNPRYARRVDDTSIR